MLKLYNNLAKKKQEFKPINENKVLIYVCGPTVYDSPHIGHARAAVSFDILRRYFLFNGFDVKFVSNYTDIDDKMINRSNELGISIKKLAKKYIDEYEDVMLKLNVIPPDVKPLATETIAAMLDFIKIIKDNGYAYVSNDSVYYDVTKYKEYYTLFMRKPPKENKKSCVYEPLDEENTIGDQDSVLADSDKRCKDDFVLWKKSKEGEPSWKSPYGNGRPGWHIECSTMAYKHLDKLIDIHGGGKDLIFPHHTNEIAQTYAAFGTKLARFWVHNGFVNIDNEKMSKSLNNFFTVNDVLKSYDGVVIRFFLSSVNYRTPINYSTDSLEEAKTALEKIKEFYKTIKPFKNAEMENDHKVEMMKSIQKLKIEFISSMDDDLNTSKALAQIYQLIKMVNKHIFEFERNIDEEIKKMILNFIIDFANIFGILIDREIQELGVYGKQIDGMDELISEKQQTISELMNAIIDVRSQLREKKIYDIADKIRDDLKNIGIELYDMKNKTMWKYSDSN
ncbi:MAG: cysteine--tRNA ligase [Candidatus Lokiarchaeota archaeon]|nr:cysteine--tRNA ligase [Candidatus Lokiarchaeota archaeon]